MKKFVFALISTLALAQDEATGETATTETTETTEATEPEVPTEPSAPVRQETTIGTISQTSNKVTMTVTATEIYEPGTADIPIESVKLFFKFNTGGAKWSDNAFVQTYFSIQDPDISRNYMSVTCGAKYKRDQSESTDIRIENFLGANSFTVASTGAFGKKWNELNPGDASECCFEQTITDIVDPYKSVYQSRKSYQDCTASMTLYSTTDGEADNLTRNIDYLKSIREGREFNVQSGFRVWESKSAKDTDASGDATEFKIKFTDFGIDDSFLIDNSP